MKVIGEKSLSSLIEKFLIALVVLCVIALISGAVIFAKVFEASSIGVLLVTTYLSGIPAIVMIVEFKKIFKALKTEKVFCRENIKRLNVTYISSLIIGMIYGINFVVILIDVLNADSIKTGAGILTVFYSLVFAMIFLIFGIGLVVLSKIYEKAIDYKEENELTI